MTVVLLTWWLSSVYRHRRKEHSRRLLSCWIYLGGWISWMGRNAAALFDTHYNHIGSCGRCYEGKCNPSAFKDGYGSKLNRNDAITQTHRWLCELLIPGDWIKLVDVLLRFLLWHNSIWLQLFVCIWSMHISWGILTPAGAVAVWCSQFPSNNPQNCIVSMWTGLEMAETSRLVQAVYCSLTIILASRTAQMQWHPHISWIIMFSWRRLALGNLFLPQIWSFGCIWSHHTTALQFWMFNVHLLR